jgi:hypothetical protein
MTDLSPTAQAVFNAAWTCPIVLGDHPATRSRQLAAALRAAADQVVPGELAIISKWPERYEVRRQLLAIAAELEQS